MNTPTHYRLEYKIIEPFWRKIGKILLDSTLKNYLS